MGLEFLGGIANAYKGFNQGLDEARDRQQLQENRNWQREQRAYQQGQQQRQLRDQAEADALKDEIKAIPAEREEAINPNRATELPTVDDDGNPSAAQLPATRTVRRLNDEIARDYAKVLSKSGNFAEAMKYDKLADDIGWQRTTKQFEQLDASAAGKSMREIAEQAAQIFNNDPFAGSVENIRHGADGSVSLDVVNRSTGERLPKTFQNAQQLLDGLRAHYSPETYAKLRDSRIAAAREAAKEAAKVHTVSAGGMAVRGDGTVLASNNNGYIQDGVNEDGTPRLVKAGAGGRKDHFDDKQWDQAARIDKSVVSLPSPMGDKEVEDGNLRSAYMQVFNAAKSGGTMAPNEAAEHATTTVVRLKNAAADRVERALAENPKSTLTVQQAVREILKEAGSFRPAAAQAPTPGGQAASPNRIDPATQRARDVEAGRMLVREHGSLEAAEKGAAELRATIGRSSGDARAILQGELDRLMLGIEAERGAAPPAPARASAPAPAPRPAAGLFSGGMGAYTRAPTEQETQAFNQSMAPLRSAPPAPAAADGRSPQSLGDDFQSPRAREALRQRVQQSGAGGPPLSRVEALRARQLGLLG